ncbi:MAG: hypothetical protein ACYTGW_19710 [Planctomycetota bacterium]|jgi:hypothetical protein
MSTGGHTIAFDSGHLLERGTDVALYDYAHFNETLLGNRSLVLCPAAADLSCIDKFRSRFSVLLYRNRCDLEHLLQGVELYYRIVSGERSGEELVRPPGGRLGIHCVFRATEPHGDVYAAVSSWVARHRSGGDPADVPRVPHVPHIVHLPAVDDDLRGQLGIPANATVLGRHGGFDTFNIPFAREVIRLVLSQRDDLWFVFLNTRPTLEHPRVCYLPATSDMVHKTRFINTTDGMIHARAEGETFGLSVGEFSIKNKPVITWADGYDQHHVEVLGNKGIYYRTPEDLYRILMSFRPMPDGNWDAFSAEFSPEPVMRKFAAVFLASEPTVAVPTAATTTSVAPGQARLDHPRRRRALRI